MLPRRRSRARSEELEAGPGGERQSIERVGRCLGPGEKEVVDTRTVGDGEPENGGLIAVEIDEAHAGFAGEHDRARGREDRCTRAALGRPDRTEHRNLPSERTGCRGNIGRAEPDLGKCGGRAVNLR